MTAARLLYNNGDNKVDSVTTLTDWVGGTSNQVTVANDGDGSITLALPQNINTGASLQIARMGMGIAATTNHLIETNYVQSIASLHNIGAEFHQEGTGTGNREIDAGVFEAVYNQPAGTHSGTLLGVNGVLEVNTGTQSGPCYGVWGFGYAGNSAGATISSNTYLFYGSSLDLGSGGSFTAPHHVFHADPIPSVWTGEKVSFYSMFGGTGQGAFFSRGGYSIFNDAQSASSFTVRGASLANLLYVDGANDKVGIGTSAPSTTLTVSGTTTVNALFTVAVATQTIAGGDTITANQCGGVKRISSAGAVTTSTSETITTLTSTVQCVLSICNVGSNNITLDDNSLFVAGGDVVLAANGCAPIGWDGGTWRLLATP